MAEVAEKLGRSPMPHQRLIWDVAGEIDPESGLLAYDEVIVLGPRQATGKTELVFPAMTYRCTAFDRALAEWSWREFGLSEAQVPVPGPQHVLYAAQTADDSRNRWRREHLARLEKSPYRRDFEAALQRNQELITWRNGSTWQPISTTGKTAGTGWQADMPVLDELWAHTARTEIALRPTMLTRWWSQLWGLSMIPGRSRAEPGSWPYLKHKREIGRARVEAGVRHGMAFFDFAARPDADPLDERTWWDAMPGLGITVPVSKVRSDFEKMDLIDLCAEYLGVEPEAQAPRWTLVGRDTWNALYDPGSAVAGRPALGVEMAEDRSRGVIGVAGRREDWHWHVAVAEPGYRVPAYTTGVEWMLRAVAGTYAEADAWTVVIDPRRPAGSLIVPLRNMGIDVLTPSVNDVAGACGRFVDATGEQSSVVPDDGEPAERVRVFHLGQETLARGLAAARKLELPGGGFVLVKKGSVGEIIDLYSVILAMHGVDVKGGETLPEPEIFF